MTCEIALFVFGVRLVGVCAGWRAHLVDGRVGHDGCATFEATQVRYAHAMFTWFIYELSCDDNARMANFNQTTFSTFVVFVFLLFRVEQQREVE